MFDRCFLNLQSHEPKIYLDLLLHTYLIFSMHMRLKCTISSNLFINFLKRDINSDRTVHKTSLNEAKMYV